MKTNRRGFVGSLIGLVAAALSPLDLLFAGKQKPGETMVSRTVVPEPGKFVFWDPDTELYSWKDSQGNWWSITKERVNILP